MRYLLLGLVLLGCGDAGDTGLFDGERDDGGAAVVATTDAAAAPDGGPVQPVLPACLWNVCDRECCDGAFCREGQCVISGDCGSDYQCGSYGVCDDGVCSWTREAKGTIPHGWPTRRYEDCAPGLTLRIALGEDCGNGTDCTVCAGETNCNPGLCAASQRCLPDPIVDGDYFCFQPPWLPGYVPE